MKKLFFVLGSFSIIIFSGCSPKPSLSSPQVREDESAVAEFTTLNLRDKYIGSIVPAQESKLSFKLPGRVSNILVQEGDTVKAGDILATLEWSELYVAASSSNSMIQSLQQLKRATDEMFTAQINGMQYKVNQVDLNRQSLELSGNNIGNNQLGTAQLGQATSEAEYDTTSNMLNQQEVIVYSNAQSAFSQTRVFLEPLGIFIDELFGISDDKEDMDDPYGIYLWAKDTENLNKTIALWRDLHQRYTTLSPLLDTLSHGTLSNPVSDQEKKQITNLLHDTEKFLTDTRILLQGVYKTLDTSVEDSRVLPRTKINELKQYVTIYQSNLEKVLLSVEWNYTVGIKWSIDNIEAFNKQALIQRTLLGQKVSISKNQVQLTQAQLKTQLAIIDQQYQEAKEGINTLNKQKNAQLTQIDSQIAQIDGQYRQTNTQISQTNLIAPYDGIITKKMIEEGEIVNAGYPVISIWSLGPKKIVIQIADKNIASIHTHDNVSVYIPALDKTFSGTVTVISPMANPLTRRRDVEVMVEESLQELPLWSQANVLFEQRTLEGITVPVQAIDTLFWATTVTVIQNNGILFQQPIKTIGCDSSFCIISGSVSIGDKIRLQ